VKLDTEGYEDRVIKGGPKTISGASVVIVETSFYELYEGQPLFEDINRIMRDIDFYYAGCWFSNRVMPDGLILQQDSIYLPVSFAAARCRQ
jgi:hypothetical protein